ncbi:serine/threonine-protein kinase [Lentzea tibetensis]|uniref:serine/threonine-protein kinase n=1 Tax=Lentzea tibetensis TaxID=2591470 RepID=UPI0016471905|nr:serine/threonine-protein kinase [Lentzea tibetensis]
MTTGPLPGYHLGTDIVARGPFTTTAATRQFDGAAVTVLVVADLPKAARRRFRTEAAALAELSNRHIVPLADHGDTADGHCFLVTERPGAPLTEAGPLSAEACVDAALVAAIGLKWLHGNDIMHGGISPSALLRDAGGVVRLTSPTLPVLAELALAKEVFTGHEPPEVLQGHDWTAAGDVYALASTLWTLIAGRPPIEAGGLGKAFAPPPSDVPMTIPRQLAEPLRRALALAPGDRPQSAEEFARSLQGEVVTEPVEQVVPTVPPVVGDNYTKLQYIDGGSSGEVWRARRGDGVVVAIKVLHPELVADKVATDRLYREWSTLRYLDHPNVIKVHDLMIGHDQAVIVLELVEGANLRRALPSLDRADQLRLLSDAAAGLAAAHRNGLVHRDFKPDNILVEWNGWPARAILSDFGLARPVDQATVTSNGHLVGTAAYLAPELARGDQATWASDVYALGVTVHEALAGPRPESADPVRPQGLRDSEWALVQRCLASDPGDRPSAQSVADALADLAMGGAGDLTPPPAPVPWHDLTPIQSGAPPTETGARPLPDAPAEPPPPRSRRRLWIAAVSVATAVAGGVTGAVWALQDHSPPEGAGPTTSAPSSGRPVYRLETTVTPGSDGLVTVSWPADSDQLAGLKKYVVMRGNIPRGELPVGRHSFRDPNPDGPGCYYVIAIGVTAPPPDPAPQPECPPT